MQENKQMFIIYTVGILAIAALAAGAWAWQHGIVQFSDGIRFSLDGVSKPSLERKISYPPEFTNEAKELFVKNLGATKATLQKDPTDLQAWFDLAIEYRQVNDQDGAAQIWKWIAANYPTDSISRHNLGEYYFHYAKDYPKAEGYYLESIKLNPSFSANYFDLFDMYRYAYKTDSSAAPDILKEGLKTVSEREKIDFAMQLGLYFAEKKDKENALTYFTMAREGAVKAHNTQLVKEIDAQIAALD